MSAIDHGPHPSTTVHDGPPKPRARARARRAPRPVRVGRGRIWMLAAAPLAWAGAVGGLLARLPAHPGASAQALTMAAMTALTVLLAVALGWAAW